MWIGSEIKFYIGTNVNWNWNFFLSFKGGSFDIASIVLWYFHFNVLKKQVLIQETISKIILINSQTFYVSEMVSDELSLQSLRSRIGETIKRLSRDEPCEVMGLKDMEAEKEKLTSK